MRATFKYFDSLEKVVRVENSSSVYLKFSSLEEIKKIMKQHLVAPFYIGSKKLNLCLVNKLPLDLNGKSRIVLVTIYNEKIKVNVFTFYHLFTSYGEIRKIIIFKKKNYQVFIEFECAEKAHLFKQALHNVNYKNYFFIKIQFTQKKELIVNQNSLFEYDFAGTPKTPMAMSPFQKNFSVVSWDWDNLQVYSNQKFNISQFEDVAQDPSVDVQALKQRTIKELEKFDEEVITGVYLPEEEVSQSGCSIEEKENVSKYPIYIRSCV